MIVAGRFIPMSVKRVYRSLDELKVEPKYPLIIFQLKPKKPLKTRYEQNVAVGEVLRRFKRFGYTPIYYKVTENEILIQLKTPLKYSPIPLIAVVLSVCAVIIAIGVALAFVKGAEGVAKGIVEKPEKVILPLTASALLTIAGLVFIPLGALAFIGIAERPIRRGVEITRRGVEAVRPALGVIKEKLYYK